MTTIVPPAAFLHAGLLSPRDASGDPRTWHEASLDIDMRACEFIRPAAVLWCGVYALLASHRGSKCRLLVPDNLGVSVYLKSAGLLRVLQDAGIDVDDRGVRDQDNRQVVMPVTRFWTEHDVEQLADQAVERLMTAGLGVGNIRPIVTEAFAELALNAVQHAESDIGALGLIQFYRFESGPRFICAVADGGIGIRKSLERNPRLRDQVPYDWVAIELALRERVSGTGEATRGIGLFGVAADMRRAGRQMNIHSGYGALSVSADTDDQAQRTTLFPGTLASVAIPT